MKLVCWSWITSLFTIARTWCLSTDEWIKMWYIYTMEYYSAIKRNATESFVVMWMNPESITQSEVSQKKKMSYINSYRWNLKKWHWPTYLQGRNRDTDVENRLTDMEGKEKWDEVREYHWHVCTTMYKIDNQWGLLSNTGGSAPRSVMT